MRLPGRRRHLLGGLLVGLLACGSALAVAGADTTEPVRLGSAAPLGSLRLFDYAYYRKLFNKSCASLAEETARAKYYLSSALRVFASALGYKFRRESYYLAVNHMSDQSPAELALMDNPLVNEGMPREAPQTGTSASQADGLMLADGADGADGSGALPEFWLAPGENLERDLRELLAAHDARLEPGFAELEVALGGAGASAEPPRGAQTRELPLARLINTGAEARLAPETLARVVASVPAENPNYAGALDLQSEGLLDQQKPVHWVELKPPARPAPAHLAKPIEQLGKLMKDLGANLMRTLNPDAQPLGSDAKRDEDVVYADLRLTNCLFLPRNQGACGSCYAFAAVTVMEFLRCRATGKLVAMSEQYVVDCGAKFVDRLNGCNGGSPLHVALFVRNFGMHLRVQYPYRMREDQCPYGPSADPQETGYLRPTDFSVSAMVPVELWPEALEHGPLLVAMATGAPFREYGGGVYSGKECPAKATHAVLIVGHGREDGRDYWLVHNSHGTGWGEQGYMKLDKQSDCIHPSLGFAFGVAHPKHYERVEFKENELHRPESLLAKQSPTLQNALHQQRARGMDGRASA